MTDVITERLRLVALLAAAAFTADWATKAWALDALHEPMMLGALLLDIERNTVFAFSSGQGVTPPALVIAVRLAALLAVVLVARRVAEHGLRYAAGLGLVLGGGFGNAADLLFRDGGVVDFIGAGPWFFEFSDALYRFHVVFNGADLALLIGIALLAPLIRDWALGAQRRLARWERRWLAGDA